MKTPVIVLSLRRVLAAAALCAAVLPLSAGQWQSLFDGKTMGKWKEADFGDPGRISIKDGMMIVDFSKTEMGGVVWKDGVPKLNYEIELEAQRVEGGDFFCGLTFPYKEDCCSLVVGGWGGQLVGISSLDHLDASENETTTMREFETGQWYHIRVRVTHDHIEAWIDRENVVDVQVGLRKVDVRWEMEACKPLGLATWNTKGAYRHIRIRTLDPDEIPPLDE